MTSRQDRDLMRLRELRHKREESSLAQVALRQNAVRNAENAVDAATSAVNTHVENAKKKEREITGGLIGRTVRLRALANARVEFEVLAYKHADLRKTEKTAQTSLQQSQTELDGARAVYRKHRLETEKLRLLLEQRKVKQIRREIALTEAADEDQLTRHKPAPRRK